MQEIPEPIHHRDVANRQGSAEPTSFPRPRRRSHRRRVLALAGLGTVLAILVGSGISDSLTAPPSESGIPGSVVDRPTTSDLRVRVHDAAKPATGAAPTRHPHTAPAGGAVPATLPLGNETTAVVMHSTLRTLAIGASIAVVAPAGGSGVMLQGTTTTNNASATSTTMTAPPASRPLVTTDTTPYSLPHDPVTLLHP